MPPTKTKRNARIVRLRVFTKRANSSQPFSWARIAAIVSKEFPDDPVTWQRAQAIYRREMTGVLLNDGAEWYRRQRERKATRKAELR